MSVFRAILLVMRWLPVLSLLPPAAYAFARTRGGFRHEPWMKGLVAFHTYDLITSAITLALALLHKNNHGFANIDELVAYIWILTLFRRWTTSDRARRLYLVAMGLGFVWTTLGVLLSGSMFRFNDVFLTAQSLTLSTAAMFELARLVTAPDSDEPLTTMPLFWVLSGIYLFSLGALAVHATGNYLLRTLAVPWLGYPWFIRAILYYTHKIMVAKAFLCPKPTLS